MLLGSAEEPPAATNLPERPDLVFEDFERPTYDGWEVAGTAFGEGPLLRTDAPDYQGDVGGAGQRVANSHATAPGGDVSAKDRETGRLTSRAFRIERNYLRMFVGGGSHAGKTCVNLRVDGQVVRTSTGKNDNRLQPVSWDVRDLADRQATIEIVDAESGAWGNIGVDHILQSDQPGESIPLADQPDYGTLALSLLGDAAGTLASPNIPLDGAPAHIFSPETSVTNDVAAAAPGRRLAGAVGRAWKLEPGETARAIFVLAWHFPTAPRGRFDRLVDAANLRRWYATQFDSAEAVVRYVCENVARLTGETRLWNRTWYDSTLPHWLLDRALQPLCCIATATCYRFSNGRFYGYEGTYCCDGTCTHVWHYAQALARIFPELERSTRVGVDYGLAFHADTGAIDYRGEYGRQVAVDGQAGTILRMYREHQMSADGRLLERLWPRIKRSIEHLLTRDVEEDGILDGEQYNTLDASWFGEIAWLSSLYLAALRAGAAMASEVGDEPFARRCTTVADRGAKAMVDRLYNGEYFIHRIDPRHAEAVNTNDGCHIDQVLGQAWAHQVGLPRVLPPAETRSALQSLWKYNFTPDVGPYRRLHAAIPGGRWYAMPGEGGLLMCTWPKGGAEQARGNGKSPFIGYFNECMTGFEYQVVAHLVWERLVREGLAVTRTIHDRYHAARRNPWNEVECSDHYARAMASYGVFLAICGYEHHGPRGHLGFAPRIAPDDFRAPFTAAEGWGTFAQSRREGVQEAQITIVSGKLRLHTLALEVANEDGAVQAVAVLADNAQPVRVRRDGHRVIIAWERELIIHAGQALGIQLTLS
jgi:hypothetical protein